MKARHKKKKTSHADLLDLNWEMQFYELQKFKKKHGHCDVPLSHKNKKQRSLAHWCHRQRELRKFSPLKYHPDRLHKLNELGFCWGIRDDLFEKNLRHLKQYHKKYGHFNVSFSKHEAKYNSLAAWVEVQRRYYREKSTRLTPERIAKLNSIGFNWKNQIKRGEIIRYKDNDLINELKRLYILRGKPPSAEYIDKYGKYSSFVYYLHFGGIINARKVAGINSAIIYPRKYTDAQLLSDLNRLAAKLGRTPKPNDVLQHGKYSLAIYRIRFGSYIKARKRAGLETAHLSKISDKDLLNDYKRLYKLLGKLPTKANIQEHGKFGTATYERHFGGIANIRKKADLIESVN